MTETKLQDIPTWNTSTEFNEVERAVLAYTDELVLADGRVQEKTFDALRAHLSEVAIIELTYAVCSYRLHATMCRALRLEYDDVDERIVEIAAPGDGDDDVMGTIALR